jgi:hypothetical protein
LYDGIILFVPLSISSKYKLQSNWKSRNYSVRHGMACMAGMAWYGMVWYGMVWYGMVWYGMVWYGMVWYGMITELWVM